VDVTNTKHVTIGWQSLIERLLICIHTLEHGGKSNLHTSSTDRLYDRLDEDDPRNSYSGLFRYGLAKSSLLSSGVVDNSIAIPVQFTSSIGRGFTNIFLFRDITTFVAT